MAAANRILLLCAGAWLAPAQSGDIDVRTLVRGPLPADYVVAGVTPGGRRVVFWTAREVSASLRADGMRLEYVSSAGGPRQAIGAATLVYADFVSFSPQGDAVALSDGYGRETWSHKQVAIFDFRRGQLTELTQPEIAAFSPAFSPDGLRIAYVAAPDAVSAAGLPHLGPERYSATFEEAKACVAQRRVWIMMRDGSGKQPLTEARAEFPQWTADGAHILFVRVEPDGDAAVWRIPARGGLAERISALPRLENGLWEYYGYTDWRKRIDGELRGMTRDVQQGPDRESR